MKDEQIKVFAEKVQARGLSARAQAQSICFKLKGGLAVRRACYGVLKYIMDNGQANGVSIVISGKLRGQRAKAMKFSEGYMISSGNATKDYIVEAVEHVMLRQGTIGVRVTIMLPHDPKQTLGGCKHLLPDIVTINDPKQYDDDIEDNRPQPQAQQTGGYVQQPDQPQQTPGGDQYQNQTPGGPPQGQEQQFDNNAQFDQPPQQQHHDGFDQGFQQQPPQQGYQQQQQPQQFDDTRGGNFGANY